MPSPATPSSVRIERVDPLDLDLDTADTLAEVLTAANDAADLRMPPRVGPMVLTFRRLGSEGRPLDGLWLAYDGDRLVGHLDLELPHRENTDTAQLRGHVHPDARKRGIGGALLEAGLDAVREAGRTRVYSGAFAGSDGVPVLETWGFTATPGGRYAVRRIDLHATPYGHWDRLYDEVAPHAADYELIRLVGPTPEDLLGPMATLHEAINDAPADDDEEPSIFDADRVRGYDRAMAGRRQTVHRVIARHRPTGEWAGVSILCVDEFSPALAFQEDTSVVRAHRGHRLGLLMKADMLRWVTGERPEVGAVDTWNATSNHHMIAVNERLGAGVIGHFVGYRKDL